MAPVRNLSFIMTSFILLASFDVKSQVTRNAATEAEFISAYTASASNDIINFTDNIVITSEKALTKSITLKGNDFTVTVPNPGLDDMGRFNTVTSDFRVFAISNAATVTINHLSIKGGMITSGEIGGAIYVSFESILHLNNSIICNSRNFISGGGGIGNDGVAFLSNSLIIRNAAEYGGGFINMGTMFVENSTFSENRSTRSNGGGGAGENQGTLYVNNSTISNNQSTEIGGGINNYNGTINIVNSSITGNVAYGSSEFAGGGIGNNGGFVNAVNTLFAYNFHIVDGDVTNPASYELDDIKAYSMPEQVTIYYCIYHATLPSGTADAIGNIHYTGLQDGSNNTIFSGGALSKITDGTGTEIGSAYVYRPFLYNDNGLVAPTLKSGSFTLQAGNKGSQTRYADNNFIDPVIAYYDRTSTSWVDLTGTSNSGQLVGTDQVGDARTNPPAIGAIEGVTSSLYMVKVNAASNGTVNGGTIYGDVYKAGTSVTITAIPLAGYGFERWNYVLGGSGQASTVNPYTFTADRNITLIPVFLANSGGSYDITYVGNDNTSGDAPATATYSATAVILGPGTLARTGYSFGGWNTNANGSGTSYAEGATYSTGANLTLYANWQLTDVTWTGNTGSDWNTASNWNPNTIPTALLDVTIPDVTNDPVVNQAPATPAVCKNLGISSGAVLTISAGKALTVNGTLNNSNGIQGLVLKSNATGTGALLHNTANVNATVERYISGTSDLKAKKYHLVAVPFNSSTYQAAIWLDSYLYTYLEATNTWKAWGTPPNNTLQTNEGAMVYYPGDSKNYSLTGELNNGAYTPIVTYSGSANGYNLVPNPYPSAINWSLVTKTNVANSIWIFDPDPAVVNYEGYINGVSSGAGHVTNIIPAGQAFFVKATGTGLTFTNAVRVHNTKNFLKGSEDIPNVLHLVVKSNAAGDGIAVRFADDATIGFDNNYDLEKFYGTLSSPQLSIVSDAGELCIDALPFSPYATLVPLKLAMDYSGELSFTAGGTELFSNDIPIQLEDKQISRFIDLRTNPVYSFIHTPQDEAGRFALHFGSVLGIGDSKSPLLSKVVVSGHEVSVYYPAASNGASMLTVYDMQGRIIYASGLNKNGQNQFSLPVSGLYLVKVELLSGVEVTKILIR